MTSTKTQTGTPTQTQPTSTITRTPTVTPTNTQSLCGNDTLDGGEDCDDGGACFGGTNEGNPCTNDGKCTGGGIVAPPGGDGCARNCTDETSVFFEFTGAVCKGAARMATGCSFQATCVGGSSPSRASQSDCFNVGGTCTSECGASPSRGCFADSECTAGTNLGAQCYVWPSGIGSADVRPAGRTRVAVLDDGGLRRLAVRQPVRAGCSDGSMQAEEPGLARR